MKLIFRTRRIYISNAYLHISTFVGLQDEKVIYIIEEFTSSFADQALERAH